MDGVPISDAKQAAKSFVDNMGASDKAAVVSFNASVTTDQDFATDKTAIKSAIDRLNADGGTAIYDALYQTAPFVASQAGRKAIVLLSDGSDQDSRHSITEAISQANASSIPVYAIGLGLAAGSSEERALQRIATETGGVCFRSPSSSQLSQIYAQIAQQLAT